MYNNIMDMINQIDIEIYNIEIDDITSDTYHQAIHEGGEDNATTIDDTLRVY